MPFGSSSGGIRQQVHVAAHAALNLLFPLRCAGCGDLGADFCASCVESLVPVGSWSCEVCGEPMEQPGLCARCQSTRRSFRRVRSAFRFEGNLRRAIHAFKYERRRALAVPLALQMALSLKPPDDHTALLCAVPLHPQRQAQRGFNQSEQLAQCLAPIWGVPCLPSNVLQRVRRTDSQVGLDFASRQSNVANAFHVGDPAAIHNRLIVLVDDVCTTGATLDACAVSLLQSGARAVEGVTLARQT